VRVLLSLVGGGASAALVLGLGSASCGFDGIPTGPVGARDAAGGGETAPGADGATSIDAVAPDAPCTGPACADAPACGPLQEACGGSCCAAFCVAGVCRAPLFWVRADRDVLVSSTATSWVDQSGNGLTVSQSDVTLAPQVIPNGPNGKPALRFDAARLEATGAGPLAVGFADVAWFHVSRNRGTPGGGDHQVFGTKQADTPFSGIAGGFGPGDLPYALFRGGTDRYTRSLVFGSLNEWAVFDARRQGTVVELRKNGVSLATDLVVIESVAAGPIVVGAGSVGGTDFLVGDVAEVVILPGPVSDDDRTSVMRTLGARYGIPVP